jgi:hypothetical protein
MRTRRKRLRQTIKICGYTRSQSGGRAGVGVVLVLVGIALGLLVTSVACLALPLPAALVLWAGGPAIPGLPVALVAFSIGLVVALLTINVFIAWQTFPTSPSTMPGYRPRRPVRAMAISAAAGAIAVAALRADDLPHAYAVLLAFFGLAALVAICNAAARLNEGDTLEFVTHWGGLGGGLGGWRLSPAAGLVVLAIVSASAAITVVLGRPAPVAAEAAKPGGAEQAAKPANPEQASKPATADKPPPHQGTP